MSDLLPNPPDLATRQHFAARSPVAATALAAVGWTWPPLPVTPEPLAWRAWLAPMLNPRAEFAVELRRVRRVATAALLFEKRADVDTFGFGASLASLVEAALGLALSRSEADTTTRFGQPRRADGQVPAPAIVGLGSLARRWLVPGDAVTLLFVHDAEHGTVTTPDGQRQPFELHAWFERLFQRFVALVEDRGGDALSLPLDLGLRPEGGRGTLCNSIDALESWYETFGDPRERLAWTHARGVGGDSALVERLVLTLRPFVFRRTIDEGVGHEIAALKREVATPGDTSAAAVLRRAHFVVQVLQLVWGGRVAGLRTPDPYVALATVSEAGLLEATQASALADAIRSLSHAAHVAGACRPQVVPPDPALAAPMALIHVLFEGLGDAVAMPAVDPELDHDCLQVIESSTPLDARIAAASRLGFAHPEAMLRLVDAMSRRPHGPFHLRARSEGGPLGTFARRVLLACRESTAPDEALRHFEALLRVIEHRRQALQQLADDPQRLRVVANLFASSPPLSRMLVRAPGLIDRLLLEGREPPVRDRRAFEALVADEIALHGPDWEGALAAVRRVHSAETLRIGFFDLAGTLEPAEVGQQLTFLAEAIITTLFGSARRELEERCDCNLSGVAVLARGALAAETLGYHDRIDLVFVHTTDVESATATRLARALVTGLSCATPEGLLYTVETRALGAGPVGAPCVPADRFFDYHGNSNDPADASNILRTRLLLGPSAVARRLETLRIGRIGSFESVAIASLVDELRAGIPLRPLDVADRLVRCVQLTLLEDLATRARADHAAADVALGRASGGLGELGVWRRLLGPDGEAAFAAAFVFLRRLDNRLAIMAEHASDSRSTPGLPGLSATAVRRLALRLGYRASADIDPVMAMLEDAERHRLAIDAVARALSGSMTTAAAPASNPPGGAP
jgi:glutamate-ammonia-ligase adenylyltransferase